MGCNADWQTEDCQGYRSSFTTTTQSARLSSSDGKTALGMLTLKSCVRTIVENMF